MFEYAKQWPLISFLGKIGLAGYLGFQDGMTNTYTSIPTLGIITVLSAGETHQQINHFEREKEKVALAEEAIGKILNTNHNYKTIKASEINFSKFKPKVIARKTLENSLYIGAAYIIGQAISELYKHH